MTLDDRVVAAWHEAGHAIVAALLGHVPTLVTIEPDGRWAGRCEWPAYGVHPIAHAGVSVAGAIAAARRFPAAETLMVGCALHDFAEAERAVRSLPNTDPERAAVGVNNAAAELLEEHWPAVGRLAARLLAETTVDGVAVVEALEVPGGP